MRKYRKAFFLLLTVSFFSCATRGPLIDTGVPATVPAVELPPQKNYLTIVAVGDNLYHEVMIKAGEEGDYLPAYGEIRPLVEKADIAFINQETLLAGKEFGFSGYPQFNSPQKLGRAISAAGFNVVNHATNHIMDKGEKAVFATMDFWDTIPEAAVLGIHRSQEQRELPKLFKKNNITAGILSYTYGTNGLPVPADKPWLVSLIDTEIMAGEIDALRPLCDILLVSMHWGEEYESGYSKSQAKLAAFLAEHQVDLVIGHHPHVIQPVEYILRPDGRLMLCFYSLGNLISAQTQNAALLGAMAYVKVEKIKTPDGLDSIVFPDAGAIPLVTHYGGDPPEFKVYPLYAYSEELVGKHRKNMEKKELTLEYLSDTAAKIFGEKEIRYNPFNTANRY